MIHELPTVRRITVSAVCWNGPRRDVLLEVLDPIDQILAGTPKAEARKIDKVIAHLKRNRKAYAIAVYALAVLLHSTIGAGATPAFAAAAGGMSGGKNIILLLQKASFWVGMGITIWGIVEAQLDFPGWKGRILKGILGYIGILLVPLIFLELQHSLQVDVWDQIDKGSSTVDQQLATPSMAQPCGPGTTQAQLPDGKMACVRLPVGSPK